MPVEVKQLIINSIEILVLLGVIQGICAYLVLAERRVAALIQGRIGPNRVGPAGLLQPIADAVKLLLKEDVIPGFGRRFLFFIAPMIIVVTAFTALAVVPFGTVNGMTLQVADQLDVGLLFLFAVGSLGVYSLILAGWSSNSKYAFLGALRSSAQVISYEIAWGLSIISVLMLVGSGGLQLDSVVEAQIAGSSWFVLPGWYILIQPLACLIFFVSVLAETNRLPFDLPEAEQELVAGYHTEYSGMRFGMFFVAEYANLVLGATIFVVLFLGGWHLPFVDPDWWQWEWLKGVVSVMTFMVKMAIILFIFIWIRWTLPRFRYDQLMRLGWKVFIPLALLNVFITGIVVFIVE